MTGLTGQNIWDRTAEKKNRGSWTGQVSLTDQPGQNREDITARRVQCFRKRLFTRKF